MINGHILALSYLHLLLWRFWEPLTVLAALPFLLLCYCINWYLAAGLVRLWNRTWPDRNKLWLHFITLMIVLPPAGVALNAYTAHYALESQGTPLVVKDPPMTARDVMLFLKKKAAELPQGASSDERARELFDTLCEAYNKRNVYQGKALKLQYEQAHLEDKELLSFLHQVDTKQRYSAALEDLFRDTALYRKLHESLSTTLARRTVEQYEAELRKVEASSAICWWVVFFFVWEVLLIIPAVKDIKHIYPSP